MGSRQSRQNSLEAAAATPCPKKGFRGTKEPPRRRSPDFQLGSLLLGSEKLPGLLRKSSPAPYVRRVGWIREIQKTLRDHQRERAVHLLRLLRKGCDPWKSSDRICRQLIYHLTPHSKWHRHGPPRRKSQGSLKNNLQKKLSQDAIHLSGIPLSMRDVHRMAYYLQNNGEHLNTVDLSFTDLTDDTVCLLLPFLGSLPCLTHLSLNGNRLTRATVKELTDTMKDTSRFPFLAWVDLGNNVDISSLPQPLLVGLRKRLSQQTTLPTIHESLDCDAELSGGPETNQVEKELEGALSGAEGHTRDCP
ncbi:leucine-rich repeat-containing protein 75B isoform X2 [Elgaria multicarinata webbii]|uniref:leucine-rich repeat-containing protein 75B isoform X2 n=1 Tax=Elgaria multicarinata webbii TaxID=159646 RepID=UPI002FCCF300